MNSSEPLWVIIPAYNEAAYVGACIRSFARQSDRNFRLVVIDNASTDATADVARAAADEVGVPLEIVAEARKGTGWACRAGAEYAMSHGAALLARTDADSEVDRDWVRWMRSRLLHGYEMAGGLLAPGSGEGWLMRLKFAVMYGLIRTVVAWRRCRTGLWRGAFALTPGANLGMTVASYRRVGGFARSSIETENEDLELAEKILRSGGKIVEERRAVVYTSLRRLDHLGLRGTIRWYDRKTETADIR